MNDPGASPDLLPSGRLTDDQARGLLDEAAGFLETGDYRDAARRYQRVVGFDDPAVTGAALLGLGEALYRLDDDAGAVRTWEAVLELPENPTTYSAWRNVAAARVRDGDLQGAIAAYRQAERRAPPEDRPEIANRLGWLAKETGNTKAAGRYFATARGTGIQTPVSMIVLGITVVSSLTVMASAEGAWLGQLLWLDKGAVAEGELWRLWTVTLIHGGIAHLVLNGFALYLTGPLVERLYGPWLFLAFYLVSAAAGSVASFAFGSPAPSVGASGGVFGLIGVLFAASRTHHPQIERQFRGLIGQLGMLILINLAIGFAFARMIDNAAHIGGLLAGLWLGFMIVPGRVPTLAGRWQRPDGTTAAPSGPPAAIRTTIGLGVAVGVVAVALAIGMDSRAGMPRSEYVLGSAERPESVAVQPITPVPRRPDPPGRPPGPPGA